MKLGDLVKVKACGSYCEVTEVYVQGKQRHGGGHVWVEVLDTGESATFCIDEIEVVNESR